ncbi:hypothetical protein QVD17_16017 [Tagetes erecta]|uniref:Jacalin-type lectin domain-containing protein n=1 Tax=Tagetes erecta TaxID=13708 RepID=A0AAD8KQ70_TARER|nr:hypothetical protein QVD17_16017 [Tagetes erecta]
MEAKTQFEGCNTYGPWGGSSGDEWVYKPHEGFISKIIVNYRKHHVVDSIQFQTDSGKAEIQISSFGLSFDDGTTKEICFDCPDEYIVAISGTYGVFDGRGKMIILSISFKTNQNLYGPYGSQTGTAFSHHVNGEVVIIGFHGRASKNYIYAIGVYGMPKALALATNSTYKAKFTVEPCSSMPIMAMPREAGPWGACGGKPWDDGVFSTIKQVRVHLGELNFIYALQFEYLKKDGKSVLSQIHGGTDGSKIELVDLDGEEEFLTGISGFYGPVERYNGFEAITSITFHTNKRIQGPFGEEDGAGYVYFSSAASPGKVVGFQGRNKRVDASSRKDILKIENLKGDTSDFKGCISHGPWGGSIGTKWVYMPQGCFIKNITISVRHGLHVHSITFQTDAIISEAQGSTFGGKGGGQTNTICINYPNEYLKSISGTYGGVHGSDVVVTSISFTTNKKQYGRYGSNYGNSFSCNVTGGMIVGFHGRANEYLNSIGVFVKPDQSLASGSNSTFEVSEIPSLVSSMSRLMAMPRDAGPWGTCGGKPWDDGVFETIKQVRVHLGKTNAIYAIQFEYLNSNSTSVLSQIHGGTDGVIVQLVDLDVKDEYLTGISGFYGPVKGHEGVEAIVSITFYSNQRIHGPYGEEMGAGYVYFSSTPSSGKVVGFHGRNNNFLSGIGVHMEYF